MLPGPLAHDDSLAEPRAIWLLTAFLIVAIVLTFPHVAALRGSIAGDSGDSLLNLWIIRSVQRGLPLGWRALWSTQIFYPATNVLAYSDTLLPVAILHWPLRMLFGDAAGLNAIYLTSWVLSCWCTYKLASRVTDTWTTGCVAAAAYTYSAVRLVHHEHLQLVIGGALVPMTLLAAFRYLDRPAPARGAALGAAFTALALTASYDGALMIIVLVIVLGGSMLADRRTFGVHARALAAAALVVLACAWPVDAQYVRLQRRPEFRRGFDPVQAAHADDFLSTGPGNYLLSHAPVIASRSRPWSRGIENRLFPGFVALTFGFAGLVVLISSMLRTDRERLWPCEPEEKQIRGRASALVRGGGGAPPPVNSGVRRGRERELVLISLAGLACLILAFGDRVSLAGHDVTLPFALMRRFVPGFAGIRATARFTVGAQLALALLAAFGVDRLIYARSIAVRIVVPLALTVVVVAESAMTLAFVHVPTRADDGGVVEALRERAPGAVLELPIESSAAGPAWPYVEAPRQLEAIADGHPRVNGYSGFEPKNFVVRAAILNEFPSAGSLALAHTLGVRYIVLRTQLVGALSPAELTPQLAKDGVGLYAESTVRRLLSSMPKGAAARIDHRPGGFIIELAEDAR
jgi:hypothetical protein